MKTLAIHGHPARGKEVIEILEMLGGENKANLSGNGLYIYYIDCNNRIDLSSKLQDKFVTFHLEEFLEKYPYKIGDKVLLKHDNQKRLCTIEEMGWNNKEGVVYSISFNEGHSCWYSTDELLPYKEEIKAEDRLKIYADPAIDNDSKTDIIINGEKLIAPNGYTVKTATMNGNNLIVEYVKNKPQYPNTYDECYEIMNIPENKLIQCGIYGYKAGLLSKFQELLICRDAYWKIADNWKPYWNNDTQFKFIITCRRDNIIKDTYTAKNCILAFPTEEMRDIFLESFKELIEKCKEFL